MVEQGVDIAGDDGTIGAAATWMHTVVFDMGSFAPSSGPSTVRFSAQLVPRD